MPSRKLPSREICFEHRSGRIRSCWSATSRRFIGAKATEDDAETFNGGSYQIGHRDTNTLLTVQLAKGRPITVRSGMLHSPSYIITEK
jgi:hypothetical protein